MKLPILFARTNTNAIQQWEIEIIDNRYRTIHGQVGGQLQTTEFTVCNAKNTGKANETSSAEQAQKEANAIWKKKKESGYWENINDIDNILFVEPMLAKKYEDYEQDIIFPIYSQPKLDGVRNITNKNGMFSRNGKPFVSCPHIFDTLKPLFDKYPNLIFDGELYCDKLSNDFNKIISLVKKTKPTLEDLEESKNTIQYWIYDIVDTSKTFSERTSNIIEYLLELIEDIGCIKIVPTYVAANKAQLDQYYEKYLDDGYEGQMVRLDKPYENKRSKNLLKRKEFQDAEYQILDIVEGEGQRTGMAGYMCFENHKGIAFKSNIKGDRTYLRELLENKEKYIGQLATIKYFNLTPQDEIPRFPYVVAIRNYE